MNPEKENAISHSPVLTKRKVEYSGCSPIALTKKPKTDCTTETDRVRELPDKILMSILERFRQRRLIDLRILSRRRKQLCDSHSHYNLSWDTMFCTQQNGTTLWEDEKDACPCLRYNERFVQGVNQLVEFNKSPHVSYFRLFFCLGRDCASEIDRWVTFTFRKGVRDLFLELSCWRRPLSKIRYRGNETYIMDSRLFSEGGARKRSAVHLFKPFLRNLPPVKLLSLDASTNWVHCLPESISFRTVRKLHFYSPDDVDLDSSKMSLILKAFPFLEYLRLTTKDGRGGQIDAPVQFIHKSLKEVNLCGFSGIWEQLEFVKFCWDVRFSFRSWSSSPASLFTQATS